MADVTTLTDLYNRFLAAQGTRGRPMSHRDAARRAGNENLRETFRRIGSGVHSGVISEETVEALVRLGLSEREVRRAAGHQLEVSPGPFALPPEANRLSLQQRAVVLSVVTGLLDAYDEGRQAVAEQRTPLRAVASGQRTPAAQREAKEKAAKARREQGST